MTSAKKPPGLLLPGTKIRLSWDIEGTEDPNHFTFTAIPTNGEARAWRISGDIYRTERGPKVTRLNVETDPDSSVEITGSLMRQIPIGTFLDYVRGRVSAALTKDLPDAPSAPVAVSAGRTEMTDGFLRDVALSYLRETAPGKPQGATRRLAEAYGRPEQTVRTWLARARKEGWLGPSAKGRAGADPGPRLTEVSLDEMKQIYPDLIEHAEVGPKAPKGD